MIDISEYRVSRMVEMALDFIWPYACGFFLFLAGCILSVMALWNIPYITLDQAKNMAFLLIIGSACIGVSVGILWQYGFTGRKLFWIAVREFIINSLKTTFPWPLSKEDRMIIHWLRRSIVFVLFLGSAGCIYNLKYLNFNSDFNTFAEITPLSEYILYFAIAFLFGLVVLLLLPDLFMLPKLRISIGIKPKIYFKK